MGSAPSVNFWQIGHSRSPKYWIVTGAVGEPMTLPFWGIPADERRDFVGDLGLFVFGRRDAFFGAAAGGDQHDHDRDHHDGRDDPELRQTCAPHCAGSGGFLHRLALRARLVAALLAREVCLVALHWAHTGTFTDFWRLATNYRAGRTRLRVRAGAFRSRERATISPSKRP